MNRPGAPIHRCPRLRGAPRVRAAAGLAAGAMALAACGGSEAEPTVAEDEPETRTVSTVEGDVEIPAEPRRVVTTHNIATQPLIDLGVVPVGVGDLPPESAYPDYWEAIEDLPQVGNGLEADIEAIVGLEPDVIFAINSMEPNALDQLRQVAPVVVVGITGPQRADWQGRAELVAEVTGTEEQLASLEEEFEQRAAQIADTHADTLAEETFVVLDAFEAGSVVPYGPTSMVGEVLEPTGVEFAPSASSELVQAVDENPEEAISFEQLPEVLDGSVILHASLPASGEPSAPVAELLDSPLLLASDAAEAGRVYPIGKTLIAGYGDAFAALDLFEASLDLLEVG